MRGYFGIGIDSPIKAPNLGVLWRTAYCFDCNFTFQIGGIYVKRETADTPFTHNHIPHFVYKSEEDFLNNLPQGAYLCGVEIHEKSKSLISFSHPERAVYLLGSENKGLNKNMIGKCDCLISIPSRECLNVSVTGSMVMYDRISKLTR